MPRTVLPLNDTKIRKTKPGRRPPASPTATGCTCSSSRAAASGGGSTTSHQGRRKTLSFGTYPEVSARRWRGQRRAEAREKVAAGIDPSRERQEAREAAVQAMTFGEVADEWLERQQHVLAPSTFEKATWMLKTLVGPWLGKRPIAEIEPPELLTVLRRIESPRQARDRASHQAALRPGVPLRHRDRPCAPRPLRRPARRADTRTVRAPRRRDGPGAGGRSS